MKNGPLFRALRKAGDRVALASPVLPDIDPKSCSFGRLAASSCAACATACPRAALEASDEGLTLDPEACSACGACVAVCPQGAIRLGGLEALAVRGRLREDAGLICPRRAKTGVCLQALGLRALAALWLAGTRRIVGLTADCATCPEGAGLDFEGRLGLLNQLLTDRDLPVMVWQKADAVPHGLPLIGAKDAVVNPLRRALLGGLVPAPARDKPLARLQSLVARAPPRLAFVPQIDPARCTGCDACIRLCPEAALSLIKDESGGMVYQAISLHCSGCGLCADVCHGEALTVRQCHSEAPDVALTSLNCRGCGVDVHVPTAGPWATSGLCPICALTGHHKRLHQVVP